MLRALRGIADDEGGLTAVELLVATVIAGVIGAAALNGIVSGLQTSTRAERRVEALVDLQRGVERASRDLRAARPVCPTSGTARAVVVIDRPGGRQRVTYETVATAGGFALQLTTEHLPAGTAAPCTAAATATSSLRIVDRLASGTAFAWVAADGTAALPEVAVAVDLLLARPQDGASPLPVQTRVAIRNRNLS